MVAWIMETKLPSSLKWLVNRRARLAWEIERTLRDASKAKNRARSLEITFKQLKCDLASIDRVLSMHEIELHPESISDVGTHRQARLMPFSHLTRHTLSCLRKAKGEWCSTTEIMSYVASKGALDVDDEVYGLLRLSVRKRLRTLYAAGKVRRRHAAKSNVEGYWALPLVDPE